MTLIGLGTGDTHVSCVAVGCSGPRCNWEWAVHRGNGDLIHIEAGQVTVQAGRGQPLHLG